MKSEHRSAQDMFLDLGARLGYDARPTFSTELPTDGVWFQQVTWSSLPVAAIEVVVSEGPKRVRGSVTTLELVSPALGVVLIHEDAITRRLLKGGASLEEAEAYVGRLHDTVLDAAVTARQRIDVWSVRRLEFLYGLHHPTVVN